MIIVFILGLFVGGIIVFFLLKNFNSFVCGSIENNIQKEKEIFENKNENKDDNKEKTLRFLAFKNMQGEKVTNDLPA